MGGPAVRELYFARGLGASDPGAAAPAGGRRDRLRELNPVEIRSPLGARLAQAGTCAAGGLLALVGTIALAGRGSPWAVLAAGATAVWAAYFWRLIGLSVSSRDDVLEVRNMFATRRVRREAVRAVRLGTSNVAKAPSRTVVLDLEDGTELPLDACARTVQRERRARRVEEYRRRVAGWAAFNS